MLRREVSDQSYGGKATYDNHLSQVPCRYVEKSKTGFNSITAEWLEQSIYKLHVPFSEDVKTGDRVKNISFKDNSAITKNFEIENIVEKRGRMTRIKVATLKQIS